MGLAPPLTRGSTPLVAAIHRLGKGSPAHAGIDPTKPARSSFRRRLPRSRGDRPETVSITCPGQEVPLLTRGSTQPLRHGPRPHPGPPLTRGSTPLVDRLAVVLAGSPAHAGIDPSTCPPGSRAPWLPRSRGDRPSSASAISECRGLPRSREDRPVAEWFRDLIGEAPPLTRGSTHYAVEHAVAERCYARAQGLPAISSGHRLVHQVRVAGDDLHRPPRSRAASPAPAPSHAACPPGRGSGSRTRAT